MPFMERTNNVIEAIFCLTHMTRLGKSKTDKTTSDCLQTQSTSLCETVEAMKVTVSQSAQIPINLKDASEAMAGSNVSVE